ncbi:MAG: hemolysin family protein [Acholeplasma sp.]|jgi:putative hemolysin|nr:hemolysin family protein [Acholeplasma sp.]
MELPLIILLLVVLILTNAFFALTEMAFVSVNKNKLKMMIEDGNNKAKEVLALSSNQQKFLPTIQVGITLAGFFSSASAARFLADDIGVLIAKTGLSLQASDAIAFVVVTIVLSLFTLVLGELVPKRIALKHPEAIAFNTYKMIRFMMTIFAPFVWILAHSTNVFLRLFRINPNEDVESYSEEEIISLIESSAESGGINEEESEMINSIFEFNDITAQEIMTPRTEVFMIDINEFSQDTIDEMIEENYSRIPIYDESPDDIIGIVYIKDVFRAARKVGFENIDLKAIMNKPYFVPARKKINALFRELQASKNYMGILVDEYGGFQGIVTIEDLIEEIMGDIYDEYDDDVSDIKEIRPNEYLVNGLLSIEEVNEALDIEMPEDDSYETIAGFILSHIGYIPDEQDEIILTFDLFTLKVEKMDEKRIDQVLITKTTVKTVEENEQQS